MRRTARTAGSAAARSKGSRPGACDRKTAAAYIGKSPKTLANWASLGVGPKVITKGSGRGRHYVGYRYADLDAWLEGNTR